MPYYEALEEFQENKTKLFSGIDVKAFEIYADSSQWQTFDHIYLNAADLDWQNAKELTPVRDQSYWLRVQIAGSPSFHGRQIFHVAQEMGNDLHAFDTITVYAVNQFGEQSIQQTGRKIKMADKPLQFWANLIALDIQETDSLEVFIRLAGPNLNYPLKEFNFWHLDYDNFFTSQFSSAIKASLFYGILGIQVLFFLFLFLIDKELIYFSFSVFGLGMLLTRAFTEFNFSSYVPIPSLVLFNEPLFHSSVYLTVLGGLFFLAQFLNIPKDGFFIRRVIPIYLVVTLISYLRFIFRYSFSDEGTFPMLLTPAPYTFFGIFLGVYMCTITPSNFKKPKLWFFLAILPAILGVFLILLNNEAHLTLSFDEAWLPEIINKQVIDDILRIALIVFVMTLSLNVGYRSLVLKSEKEIAIQENLKAQQTIFENQLRAEQLEEMDLLKTKLYTNITHEFRTPLTVILGINNELTETNQKLEIPDAKKESIFQNQQLIQRNSENLLNLVNQLLDLSSADNQQLSLQFTQGDILSFLNYLTESFFSKAKEKNIRLVFYTELQSLVMDYDEQKMQQIVFNLLSNALKFTSQNGKIVFHAYLHNDEGENRLQLKVSDNGFGILPEKLPYIFDRFYQADDSIVRQGEGSGIGLALTKEIVNLLGGEISVESEIKQGTVFTVLLPIHNNAEFRAEEKTYKMANLNGTATEADVNNELINHLDEDEFLSDDRPTILIVEDNKDVLTYLKQILYKSYDISESKNGELGILKAIEIIPDLIITDVMMPVKDGYQLTQTLKQDTRTSHIPIILLTAKAKVVDKLEGLKHGADAYLYKPFNKEELLIRLERLLANREALKQYYNSSYKTDPSETTVLSSQLEDKEEQFLEQLKQIIVNDLKNDRLNAEYLSMKIGVSKSQLYRKLKALIGATPNTFIRNIRLQTSLNLLQETELNISEIAYNVGFSNPSYFSKSFNKRFGKAPFEYRKQVD